MIASMTGYGDAQASEDGVQYALELRSLNNRYFKASIKLPEMLQFMETDVEKLLRTRLGRGSISLSLRVRGDAAGAAYEVNRAALLGYIEQIGAMRPPGDATITIDLGTLLLVPGVCQPPQLDQAVRQRYWQVVERLTLAAMDGLVQMRRREGLTIREDLLASVAQLRDHLLRIAARAPLVVEEYQRRLQARVAMLLSEGRIELDLDTLMREVAIFAERCDINEEVARLTAHLDQFAELCDSREYAGRKLDFLAQELLREVNTIGSKSNDATIARSVVEMKGLIDRLKEQVQNVE
jgi:uncharacterized protein (TIGR00255 family)